MVANILYNVKYLDFCKTPKTLNGQRPILCALYIESCIKLNIIYKFYKIHI